MKVSGVVQDQAGLPLPGVNVLVKGTTNGVQTDFDGKFQINAAQGQVLVFSFLGMKTQERPAAANMTIKLVDDSVQLEGVVITALGISRDKKSLGYASQKVDGSAVNTVPTNNFINNLSGKVAGLEIRNNSNFGGSTNIVLRGSKSITGNNQALMVVDGVPVSNTNLNKLEAANSRVGFDFGNSTTDIDPNNIESITVLKGAAATALYGSQAANGAIMITTKKGKLNTGLGITFSSTTSIGRYDKKTFPKYQHAYGANGYSGADDSFYPADVDGDGVDDLIVDMTADSSYGNAFDPNLSVYQWNASVPGNPNYGKATPWVAAKNDPGSFFQDSFGTVNNINFNGGDEKSTYNFSYTNNNETGILPNSRLNKNSINGNFSRNLADNLRITAFSTFTDQSTVGRNSVGYGDNIMGGFRQWWQMNVDIKELKDAYMRTGQNWTWNMNDPYGLNTDTTDDFKPAYWNNPYWDRYENYQSDDHTRLITGGNLSWDVTKNLNLLGRVTVETSDDRQEYRKNVGSHAEEFGLQRLDETSGYRLYTRHFLQSTYDFIATYDFTAGKFGGKALLGTTFIKSKIDSFDGSTTGGLIVPRLYTLANSVSFVAPVESEISFEKQGFYGQLSLDWDKTIFVEGSYRNDISTALPTNNNSYDYYSIGGSLIVSELIKQDWLSNLKLRANYAVVGNDPAAGLLGARVNNSILNGNLLFGNSVTYVDFPKLKPEEQKSTEFGIEGSLFQNRVTFDVSLYKSNTENQIFEVPQSTSTGYGFSLINAGEIQNKGVEVAVTLTPIKTNNFKWDLNLNWSKNKNEVVSLDAGRKNLQLATFQGGMSLNATVGEPYGTFRSTDYVYDASGNRVVDEDGYYLTDDDKVIGNIQADWVGGIYNKLTYKDLSFGFLIDIKKGGDVYSLDQAFGQYTGLYQSTAGLNDLGLPVRNSLDNGGGIVLPGVHEDGTPNTTRIEANYVGAAYGYDINPNKAFIYDASYVKLREVSLTYALPSKYFEGALLKSLSLSLLGNNLWIIDKNLPDADPEAGASSGNIQGYQSGVMPTTKVYSFNIKASF
ncbi:SusC/RagA family TonB-linked outer membrane protein [Flavobacterium sp.]|uniref:SusC/RagA family TonB-linked outer membrane protein n=1 Tax=Flavobacterium sp. TaxID=239 RepID=UPI0039E5EBEB